MSKRLGKGLAQIVETAVQASPSYVMLRADQIRPSRYQPRQAFDQSALEELKASIKQRGIIQPVIVRPIAHGIYELVAGERRWRATQLLGIQHIPSIIKALSDQEALEYSLIENLQREELNPLEEARALAKLTEEFGYTQERVAETIGKDRSSVANALRLLKLPPEIQHAIRDGKLTAGHAKALLGVELATKQLELLRQTVTEGLSVRQLEALVSRWQPKARRRRKPLEPQLAAIEEQLRQLLGTKVNLSSRKRGGRIVIEYFSSEDLTRLLQALGLQQSA